MCPAGLFNTQSVTLAELALDVMETTLLRIPMRRLIKIIYNIAQRTVLELCFFRIFFKNGHEGNDKEKVQSERNSHFNNRREKNLIDN